MNRLGWGLLLAFLLVIGGFAVMVRTAETPADAPPATGAVATPAAGVTVAPSGLAIPVAGRTALDLVDTFADARGSGRVHDAIDIMAPRGTPVVAAAPGTVERIFESEAGGHTVYVRGTDRRFIYYYAHLDRYTPGLAEGQRVARGARLGDVGFTGNASPEGPHLHFAIMAMAPGEGWAGGRAINPYPLLAAPAAPR